MLPQQSSATTPQVRCSEACVVPAGTVKAVYVVTNLALARDVSLKLVAE